MSSSSVVPAAAISSCILSPATRKAPDRLGSAWAWSGRRCQWSHHAVPCCHHAAWCDPWHLGRDVDANGRTMPRDGNRGRRLQIAGEVLPKLANPNFGALRSCVLTVYIIMSHCPLTRRQRPTQCAAPRAGLVHSLPPITVV